MKIFVEQIIIDQSILVYSNFCKYTDNEDEEGSDFEYDFEALYGNVDNIQTTIVKLYGTQGLVKIFNYFAQGSNDLLTFEPLEFEEDSPLRLMVEKIVSNIKSEELIPSNDIVSPVTNNVKDQLPSDSIFLLSGLLSGLPENEDLNVMRMLASAELSNHEIDRQKYTVYAERFGMQDNDSLTIYSFDIQNSKRVVVFNKHTFISLIDEGDSIVVDYPSNPIQEKSFALFDKYIDIQQTYKLKKSIIIECSYNALAKSETSEGLPNYLLLFNVESGKFESKEKN